MLLQERQKKMDSITIEPVTSAEEYPVILKLAREIWGPTYAEILSQEQIDYMIDMMYALAVLEKERGEGIVFELVKENGKPIGFLSYGPYKPGTMKLHKLYLSQSHHGKGIGSRMLSRAKEAAKELGATELLLNVNKHNARAIRAYRRNGFEMIREEKNPIGNGFFMDDYVFGIKLTKETPA